MPRESTPDALIDLFKPLDAGRPRTTRFVGVAPTSVVPHFQGRRAELELLSRAFAEDQGRLVVITGRAGTGKTTLVSRFLQGLSTEVAASVVLLTLTEGVHHVADRLLALLAQLAGTPQAEPSLDLPVAERLAQVTASMPLDRVLVVVHNAEVLLDGDSHLAPEHKDVEALLAAILDRADGPRVIATSRRMLILPPLLEGRVGRWRLEVQLDGPLSPDECIQMLRALDPDGALGLRGASDDILADVARRCHGYPRTLEALVGSLRQRRTSTLATLLDDPQALARIALDPARILHETLDPRDQRIVQALAVFDEPVPVAALRSMLPGLDPDARLDRLVHDLVVAYARGLFSLHSLDREYTLAQIPDEALPALHGGAASWYARASAPPRACKSLQDLDPILRCVRHLVLAGRAEDAARALQPVEPQLLSWGYARLVLKLREEMADRIHDLDLRARHLTVVGQARARMLRDDAAEPLLEALQTARSRGDASGVAGLLETLGTVAFEQGELEDACRLHDEGLDVARALGDRRLEARHLGGLAMVRFERGHAAEAAALFEQASALAEEGDDPLLAGALRTGAGSAWKAAGDRARSAECYGTALPPPHDLLPAAGAVTELGSKTSLLLGIRLLAECRVADSEQVLRNVVDLCAQRLEMMADDAMSRLCSGLALMALGRTDEGLAELRAAIERREPSVGVDAGRLLALLSEAAPGLAGLAQARALISARGTPAPVPPGGGRVVVTTRNGRREMTLRELAALRAELDSVDLVVDETTGEVRERVRGAVSFGNRRILGRLLVHLMERAGTECHPQGLTREVWESPTFVADTDLRTVRVNVSRLRKLIEPKPEEPRYILMRPARFGHPVSYLFNPDVSFCLVQRAPT